MLDSLNSQNRYDRIKAVYGSLGMIGLNEPVVVAQNLWIRILSRLMFVPKEKHCALVPTHFEM